MWCSAGCSGLGINQEAHGFVSLHSLDVSPQVEPDPAAPPHHLPCSPWAAAPPTPAPTAAPLLSTNLFVAASPAAVTAATAATSAAAPEATPSGFSGVTNPFLTSLQSNPFFEELVALNSPSPAPSLPRASRADPAPLAFPGKALPEWDDTFNFFAVGRLPPEARSEVQVPAGVGLEVAGPQDLGPRAVTVKAAEPLGGPGGGGGRGGSNMWPGPSVPLDLGLDQQSASEATLGLHGPAGASPPAISAQLRARSSASDVDSEPPAPDGEAGQSSAGSGTSLFSSPEVISVWERLPGPEDNAPEAQDEETSRGESQLFHELDTVDDSWPWDVVTVSPAAEMASPVQGESDVQPLPQVQPELPETRVPRGSEGPACLEPDPQAVPKQVSDKGLQPGSPPPKPPRLFTPSHSLAQEEEQEQEKALDGPRPTGAGTGGEDTSSSVLAAGRQDSLEEGEKLKSEEAGSSSSGVRLGEPGLEDVAVEDASAAPASGPCPPVSTSCSEDPAPASQHSASLSQQIWGAPETQSQGPVEEVGPLSVTPQQPDPWAEDDTLEPFLSQESRDPPSLPSTSPPGSRESSIRSGPEELPTPPEPAFPPPLPPWASHRHGGPDPLCSPVPGVWSLTSSSPPLRESASHPGGAPALLGEDHAAATPASPLVLLPLETRPAEEPQPSTR